MTRWHIFIFLAQAEKISVRELARDGQSTDVSPDTEEMEIFSNQ